MKNTPRPRNRIRASGHAVIAETSRYSGMVITT